MSCPPITWKHTTPIWVDQWPLTPEKLTALRKLVEDLAREGRIESSTSPYNSPVFVIRKKSGKWRMLIDLRQVNKCMETTGATQPGLHSPEAITKVYSMMIIDIKDCFYSIPLHPADRNKFAFSVPAPNYQHPYERYQFKVLPQGMANSPTLCQMYVHQILKPVRLANPEAIIIHYMDDILVATAHYQATFYVTRLVTKALAAHGLTVAPEKIQSSPPFNYLGHQIDRGRVIRTPPEIDPSKIRTLNDFQKLIGAIQWMQAVIPIPDSQMYPLYDILKGDSSLLSPREWTPAAREQ